MQQIIHALGDQVPITVFGRGVHHNWDELIATGANALSIDWNIDLPRLSQQLPDHIALQGNLDPALLTAAPEVAAEKRGNCSIACRVDLDSSLILGMAYRPMHL